MAKRIGLRDRLLRASFFTSEQVCSVSLGARLLFQGLWCMADREGRLEDRARLIKKEVYPWDDITAEDVERMIGELVAAVDSEGVPLVRRYTKGNTSYLCIPGFKSNQKCHPNEAKSVIPPPDGLPKVHDVAIPTETYLQTTEYGNLPPETDSEEKPSVVHSPDPKPKEPESPEGKFSSSSGGEPEPNGKAPSENGVLAAAAKQKAAWDAQVKAASDLDLESLIVEAKHVGLKNLALAEKVRRAGKDVELPPDVATEPNGKLEEVNRRLQSDPRGKKKRPGMRRIRTKASEVIGQ